MLICYPATGRCCAPPKSIDIKTNHFEHPPPPHPPTSCTFFFGPGVIHTPLKTFKNLTSRKPPLMMDKKTSSRPLNASSPSHRCDLDANGAASPSPASALRFAATPPRVRFGGAAQKAQPLGRNWGRKDDGGAGKKWFRMPGIFPYKNEEPLQ